MAQSSDHAFSFADLTPDAILDAIESTGIYVDSGLLALNSYENRVYQFSDEDNTRYVVKFYRPNRWTREQILEEHEFAFALQEDEVPVVAPVKRDNESLFEFGSYWFALYPSVGGRQFEIDNAEQLEWMGRYIARIHQTGKGRQFIHRPSMSIEEYVTSPIAVLKQSDFVPDYLKTSFFTVLEQVAGMIQFAPTSEEIQCLHGDCHIGNILWTPTGPMFVDLDDSRMGPVIQDIWMMLSGDRSEQLSQLDALLKGYEEFGEIDESQFAWVEPLRAMRMIHYMGWLARRWEDAAFPRNFSWFTSDKYWEQQTLALKEQLAALHEPSLMSSGGNF